MFAVTGKPTPKRRHVDLGSAFDAVATDIIFEILSRLPVKTLCRFSGTPSSQIRPSPLLLARVRDGGSLRLMLMDMEGNVVRSMDGVVGGCWMLCSSLDDHACIANDSSPNPEVIDLATGKMLLPRSKIDDYYGCTTYIYGFGRTASSHVYKVVRVMGSRVFQTCAVLTLGDGAGWRETYSHAALVSYFYSSVTINGAVYFLESGENNILSFDLESEAWNKKIEGPRVTIKGNPSEKTGDANIAELNGALCMVQINVHKSGHSYIDIWLLTESENNSWSKKYTIRMATRVDLVKPLRMMPEGGKLLFYYSKNSTPMMQIYDPHDETCTNVMRTATTGLTDAIVLCNLRLERLVSASRPLV